MSLIDVYDGSRTFMQFDPIYQEDYYRLATAFWAGFVQPGSRDHLGGPSPEQLGLTDVFGWTDRDANPPRGTVPFASTLSSLSATDNHATMGMTG